MDFLQGLNPQQRAAVSHAEGPLLLLAGAGSGKTRVITHRIAHLMEAHHVPGPSLLAVTFTNKASDEMRQRVRSLIHTTSAHSSPLVSTFHSFCVRLLRRDGDTLADVRPGFTRQFTIYDDDDQVSILKSIFKNLGLDEKFMQYRAACSWISHNKSHKKGPQDVLGEATDQKMSRLAVVYEHYEARLRQANALDFDDLLLESVRLLAHDDQLRQQYNRRFEFVLIDEYQDTNRTQYELMRLLTREHSNICVVGDEDQSIYGWRGADIRNILDFERDFPNATVIRLEQNYRSTKNILEAASAVVANNKERKGKWLWTESGEGDPICLYQGYDAENEALFIADTIEKILARNREERVAVLYRTNFQSRQIEEALRRYGRKYLVVGGFSFYQRAEVKDVLAYVKALTSPQDSLSLLRIINTPARGIGKTTVEQIEQYALENNLTLWDAIGKMLDTGLLTGRAEAALRAFVRVIEELTSIARSHKIHETLEAVLDKTGYLKMLETDKSPDSDSRIGNLNELINAAAEASERGESLTDFLDHAALVADSDDLDERAQVSLLTMHNAKGLEFPVVFIAGLEEGLFPHTRSFNDPTALEEERRLCYVGMTRAEKRLYLTWAQFRRRYGGGQPERSIPSRFLNEVPRQLTQSLSKGTEREYAGPDLYSESQEVRETVKRNLYTGKTYNSLDNINEFFAGRGIQPRAVQTGPVTPNPAPAAAPPAAQINTPSSSPPWKTQTQTQMALPMQPPAATPTRPATPATPSQPAAARPVTQTPARTYAAPVAKKRLASGSTIIHPKYGRGTVLRREGEGEDAKLTVSFPGYGLKKLVEKYAGIKEE